MDPGIIFLVFLWHSSTDIYKATLCQNCICLWCFFFFLICTQFTESLLLQRSLCWNFWILKTPNLVCTNFGNYFIICKNYFLCKNLYFEGFYWYRNVDIFCFFCILGEKSGDHKIDLLCPDFDIAWFTFFSQSIHSWSEWNRSLIWPVPSSMHQTSGNY